MTEQKRYDPPRQGRQDHYDRGYDDGRNDAVDEVAEVLRRNGWTKLVALVEAKRSSSARL